MPTEIAVTDAEVIAAGRTLEARGKLVTGHTLRQVTRRGDPKRLAAVWKDHQVAQEPPPPVITLPPEVEEMMAAERERVSLGLEAMVLGLWQAADRISDGRVKLALAELQSQFDEQAVDLAAAEESLVQAEADRDAATAESDRRGETIHELERQLATESGRLEQSQRELQAAEIRATTAIEDAGHARDRAREDWARIQTKLTESERRDAAAEGRLQYALDSVAALTEQMAAVEKEGRVALAARATAEGELKAALARATAAEERLERRQATEDETATRKGRGTRPPVSE
jgi:Plasmid replication region DNA-binding N-term